jgi:hypothetical protein
MEDARVKLAVSWLFVAGAMTANTLLYFLVPGVLDEIRAGQIVGMPASQALILGMAVAYFWLPLVMAGLSVMLKHRINRFANLVVGSFYVVFVLFELAMNAMTTAYPYAILMDASMIVVAAFIVWNAFRWREASSG